MRSYLRALLRFWTLRNSGAAATPLYASVVLLAVWAAAWTAYDWWEARPNPVFFPQGLPLFAWYALCPPVLAALLRWRSHPAPPFDAVFALLVGVLPLPVLLATAGYIYLNPAWLLGACIIVAIYVLLYLARGLRALTGQPQRLAAFGGFVFILAFVVASDALDVVPDVWDPAAVEAPVASTDDALADQEQLLFDQSGKIDRALQAFPAAQAGAPRAFFLGFAGVADEKVFAQEIALAARVIGQRYSIGDRSLALINDARDLESAPLASVAALKYALRGIAARMDLERDVLFLAISSHGAPDPAIVVENSGLPLNDLTDSELEEALQESGIKWRVIVISACYAGGFVDALKNPHTIVLTAAAADRTSFGCGADSDLTYFGEAFYRDALPEARSLRDGFERAKSAIATRERREHVDASHPQAYFGPDMESKLAGMEPRPGNEPRH